LAFERNKKSISKPTNYIKMKKTITILTMTLLVAAGWSGCKSSDNQPDTIITVDVTKSYSPKKELILQDFMDVEYVALETTDEFVNQGFV
jgi:hypothetical protein